MESFSSNVSVMLLLAIWILLQRLPGLLLAPTSIPYMLSMCRQQGKIGRSVNIYDQRRNRCKGPLLNAWPCAANSFGLSNSSHVQVQPDLLASQAILRSLNILTLHKRSSTIVRCRLPRHKFRWFELFRDCLKELEVVMSVR